MKKISFIIAAFIIASALMAPSCNKTDAPGTPDPGPDVIGLTEGFFCTKTGYNTGNLGDTVLVRIHGGTSYTVVGTYNGGAVEDEVHYWYLENAGGNARYIRSKKHGVYLGYKTYPTAPAGYYSWALNWITLDKTPGPKNRFIITKKDKNFYIQSADDQTLYLNTTLVAQISYTGPQKPQWLFFLPKKQEFFFLKPF